MASWVYIAAPPANRRGVSYRKSMWFGRFVKGLKAEVGRKSLAVPHS